MKFPVIKEPILVNIGILIFSLIISGFTLLFGIAHLIEGVNSIKEGSNPDIPIGEQLVGWTFVIFLCVVGVIFLVIAIAAIRGILDKLNRKTTSS